MLNDITIVECEVMSHLVRLRGKDTVQCAHCALWRWVKIQKVALQVHSRTASRKELLAELTRPLSLP